jgi:hypothetical protein
MNHEKEKNERKASIIQVTFFKVDTNNISRKKKKKNTEYT